MTFFMVLPPYPLVLKLTFIFPSPPGGISLSKECLSHPQGGLTLVIVKRVSPEFLMINSWGIKTPSGTGLKVKTGASIIIFGCAILWSGRKSTADTITTTTPPAINNFLMVYSLLD
ncbi:MAG: hypothetical protein DRH34_04165 [Deltaproteobacteria bacterium]|nr:MAG: hypothetical protein DRH34_04165 [Deltaproteobacteria bacterium]